MRLTDLLLPFLIAACAVGYGLFVGRARASRLRELQANVSNGNLRGYLAIAIVVGFVLASSVF